MEKITLTNECFKMSDYDLMDIVQRCVKRFRYKIKHNYYICDVVESYKNVLITCCIAKKCLEDSGYKSDITKTVKNCYRVMVGYYIIDSDFKYDYLYIDVIKPLDDLFLHNDLGTNFKIEFYI